MYTHGEQASTENTSKSQVIHRFHDLSLSLSTESYKKCIE